MAAPPFAQFLWSAALGLGNSGARPHFGRKSSVFVPLYASVVAVCCCCHRHCCYCSFLNPLSSVSTLLGGINENNPALAKTKSASQAQAQAQTQTQNKTKQKQMCSNGQPHADASPARAVKCLSSVSDRDADNRSRLPDTHGAVKCLSPASDRDASRLKRSRCRQ